MTSLWQAVWEEDGKTVKAPGVSETEVKRCVAHYLADTFDEVYKATEHLRADPERLFLGIGRVEMTVTDLRDVRAPESEEARP